MLTERFACALAYAEALHRGQTRKGTPIPYISHLMAVCSLVLEHGGTEDEAIAALLHDAVEDQGGLATARAIADRFGPRVARIVLGCSDAIGETGGRKPPWRARKTAYIARLGRASPSVGLVATCDKLHNLRCLLADVARDGPSTLARFNQPASLAWYHQAVAEALRPHAGRAPVAELKQLADAFAARIADHDLPMGSLDG